jgi:hypothetical protein
MSGWIMISDMVCVAPVPRSGVTLVSWDQAFSTDLGAGPQAARKAEHKHRGHRIGRQRATPHGQRWTDMC